MSIAHLYDQMHPRGEVCQLTSCFEAAIGRRAESEKFMCRTLHNRSVVSTRRTHLRSYDVLRLLLIPASLIPASKMTLQTTKECS